MTPEFDITPSEAKGILVLTVTYGPELMFQEATYEHLSARLSHAYDEGIKDGFRNGKVKTRSCIVSIEATTAGSPLVRALFDLWEKVTAAGGQVVCAKFPVSYIEVISSLGLPALTGFSMANTVEDGVKRLST
jgi:hypothetical protein